MLMCHRFYRASMGKTSSSDNEALDPEVTAERER